MPGLLYKVLKWTEKYTKTDMVYLFEGGFWITLGRVVATLSGFLLTLVLANAISKESLGTYKFIQSIAGIITAFSLTGMGTAVTQAVSRGNEGALIDGFRTYLKWSIVMTIGAALCAVYYFIKDNTVLAWSLILVGITLPLIQSGGFYSPYLIGKQEFKAETLYGIFYTILPPLATGVAALLTENPVVLIAAFFCTSALTTMILYVLVIKKFPPGKKERTAETLSYGKHLSAMNILGTISFQLDKILLFHYLGAAQLALYSIATAPPQQIRYLNKVLGNLALPKISAAQATDVKRSLPRKAFLLFLAAVILTILYVSAAPYVYSWFFPQYIDAIIYSQMFALIILFFPSVLFQQALTAYMDQKSLYIIQTGGPILKVTLFVILLPLFGIMGIIISALTTEVLRMGFVIYAFNKLPTASQPLSDKPDNFSDRDKNTLT